MVHNLRFVVAAMQEVSWSKMTKRWQRIEKFLGLMVQCLLITLLISKKQQIPGSKVGHY